MKRDIKSTLAEIVEKLKSKYEPFKIVLFGSYAYGNPTEDSDIDLLILKNTNERRVDRFVQVKKIIYNPNRKVPVSPLVYSPSLNSEGKNEPPEINLRSISIQFSFHELGEDENFIRTSYPPSLP